MWWRELEVQRAAFAELTSSDAGIHLHPTAKVDPAARLDPSGGPIFIGPRTRVCAGAYIAGPAVIGPDCMIGNFSQVRGPVCMGDGVRIGFATEVKNAIIEDEVLIGPQCFVADSRIDRQAYLGAQVRTSNHRFDKQPVKVLIDGQHHDTGLEKLGCHIGAGASLGIQVIVLPGRIIAPGSSFGPRTTIERNLPPGRYRLAQQLERY